MKALTLHRPWPWAILHAGKRSEKPAEARDRLVRLMGDVPRIELFARTTTPGWDVWGNEIESSVPFNVTTDVNRK